MISFDHLQKCPCALPLGIVVQVTGVNIYSRNCIKGATQVFSCAPK